LEQGGPVEPVEDAIALTAARWAARIDATPEDETDAELAAWLGADRRHAGALLRARAALAMFAPPVSAAPATGTVHSLAQPAPAATPPAGALQNDRPRRRLHRRVAAGLAGGAIAAALALALLPRGGMAVETGVGEVRRLALADGSSLAVDARSALTVRVGTSGRRQIAMDGGRALFRVTHDAARPFEVTAGAVTITDLGTVFEVIEDAASGVVDVMVSEGSVSVAGPHGVTRLVAGQRARFGPSAGDARVVAVDPAALSRTTAWTEGKLELDGEPLSAAIAEMNRHNTLQIRLASPVLADEPLYGAFRLNDPTAFADAVAASVGAQAQRRDDALVISR